MTQQEEFKLNLSSVMEEISGMLIEKNRKYGNSALEPIRIFSTASAESQILVRIDDKLSRIRNRQHDEDEDVINDLIGYLVLLKMLKIENK